MKNFKNKTVLITGGTGLIGSHLVDALLQIDAKVIVLGRNKNKITDVFQKHLHNPDFSYLEADISDGIPEQIDYINYIFHAASPISGEEIKTQPVNVIKSNLTGTEKCLEFLKFQKEQHGISGRMIVFSSATVYGTSADRDTSVSENETSRADTLTSANIAYSESKRMIEVIARSYFIQYSIETVIIRIGYVYGYTKYMPNTAFYEFIKKAVNGMDLILRNSGLSRRDNIFVEDVVKGLLLIALSGAPGEVYNISSNGEKENFKSIDEIAKLITDSANKIRAGKQIAVHTQNFNPNHKPGVKLNNTKLKNLGWSVETSIKEGIEITLRQYMKTRG